MIDEHRVENVLAGIQLGWKMYCAQDKIEKDEHILRELEVAVSELKELLANEKKR